MHYQLRYTSMAEFDRSKGAFKMNVSDLVVRSIHSSDLDVIRTAFPSGDATKHESRLEMQLHGDSNYLFAWLDEQPVGHLFLRWNGTLDEPVASNLSDCPHLEDLLVQEQHRSKGIGTALLNSAEHIVSGRGYKRIGLGVGTDNPNAKKLYERMGYAETTFGAFYSCWVEVDEHGQSKEYREEVVYLIKSLV